MAFSSLGLFFAAAAIGSAVAVRATFARAFAAAKCLNPKKTSYPN